MSNQVFHNPQTIERASKRLHLEIAIGASGAPTLNRALGVTSITRASAGVYNLVLPKFNRFLGAEFMQFLATVEDSSFQITAVNASAGTLSFMTKVAGVAADLTSGSVLFLDLQYKNTVVAN